MDNSKCYKCHRFRRFHPSLNCHNGLRCRTRTMCTTSKFSVVLFKLVIFLILDWTAIRSVHSVINIPQNCLTPHGQYGSCTKATLCTQIGDNFLQFSTQSANRLSYSEYLSSSLCGFDGYDYLVCCQSPGTSNNIRPISNYGIFNTPAAAGGSTFQFGSLDGTTAGGGVSYPNYFPQYPTYPPNNYPTFPSNPIGVGYTLPRENVCGISSASTNRVVGGNEAQRGAYPWIAALGYNQYGPNQRFLCSGSLITQRHVLTSAHCLTNELYSVRLGAHIINANNQPGVTDVLIERKILHPNFDSRTITNDVAILKLAQDVPITATVRPVCLPLSEPLRSRDYTGYNPFVAGWGAVAFQGPASAVLKDAQVPVVNVRVCEANYRTRFPNVALGDTVICAGDGVRDACQGDSGGPLMLPDLSPDRTRYNFYLIGVVSYGYECARANFPGIYSRVSPFIPWIESQLNV